LSTIAPKLVSIEEVESNRRRGGDVRTLLSPRTVGSTSGFSGAVRLLPGERVAEHYHPYSEEFLFLVQGSLLVDLDGVPTSMGPGDGLFIPIGVRHRLRNAGEDEAFAVFHLGPLAPRPELGHVDTETADGTPLASAGAAAGPVAATPAAPGQRREG
jgi:putative monooxygenase